MFLYAVGDAESLSKATTCRTLRSVYLALKGYMHIFITFPGHRRTTYVKEGLYKNAGFSNVIGALDCSHIKIKRPSGAHEDDL
ncbi:hypothetical protein ATANTOWER_024524 [Ataeniobius toweri]|uniref:Nuclease HARBI1 n=1 Tax=Ataeniobius toweri TaxID=208326 RepID=A0ABU7AZF4_9TELE|nr:hypothetical protein [Ataeniobius toweri]